MQEKYQELDVPLKKKARREKGCTLLSFQHVCGCSKQGPEKGEGLIGDKYQQFSAPFDADPQGIILAIGWHILLYQLQVSETNFTASLTPLKERYGQYFVHDVENELAVLSHGDEHHMRPYSFTRGPNLGASFFYSHSAHLRSQEKSVGQCPKTEWPAIAM